MRTTFPRKKVCIKPGVVQFDNAVLPGLDPNLGYLTLENRPAAELAQAIIKKLVRLGGHVEPAKPAFRAKNLNASGKVCRVA